MPSAEGARQFANKLRELVDELENTYGALLHQIAEALVEEFDVPNRLELREHLRHRADFLAGKVIDPRMRSFIVTAADETPDGNDWMEAIAMNIGGRPIQEWRDDDVAHFRLNLHELGSAFARLESLHFERRADRHDGFDARRITVTNPDGSEMSRVVWIDQGQEAALAQVVETAISSAEQRVGPNARSPLLALLAKRLYLEDDAGTEPSMSAAKREEIAGGRG
jgi:hypothetical protein